MFYISGIYFKGQNSISTNLQAIYGIGKHRTKFLCRYLGFAFDCPSIEITNEQQSKLKAAIQIWLHEDALRQEKFNNIQQLKVLGSYRGSRHRKSLPCRGQNTYSNAQTRKKSRKIEQEVEK